MSKTKTTKSAPKDAKASKADVLTKVKGSAVTKPAETVKTKSKDVAKEVAKKVKEDKKKKVVKQPTPEPESESESESEESEEEEDSDDSSEDDSEVEVPAPKSKAAGVKAPQPKAKEDSSDDSDEDDEADDDSDESESEDEAPKPKVNGATKSAAKPAAAADSDDSADSDDDSDESNSDESEDEEAKPKANGAESDESSEEDSDDSEDDEEEEKEQKPAAAKRKADEESPFAAKKAKVDAADTSKGPNLFIGNLSWNVDESWLRSEFEEFGELSGVRLMTDRATGRSKGFGYVEFVNAADAAKAHEAKQGAELDGRTLNVDFANARQGGADKQDNRRKSYGDQVGEPSETLFVGNLSFDADQDSLSEAFAPYGSIQSVRLPTDRETGAPKGFGYITFSSSEEAKEALEKMQGAYINNRPLRLDYSTPKPQSDSPARGGFGGRGRGGFGGNRGRGGFGDRGRGASRGGRGRGGFSSTNRGGFGDFSGKKTTF